MKKVLVIGAKGSVGSIISAALSNQWQVTKFDLPEYDLANYQDVSQQVAGKDIVVYSAQALNKGVYESWRSGHLDPNNQLYELNVLTAIIEHKIPRLIFTSSVHADNFLDYEEEDLLTVPGSYKPKSPYGAHKLILEETIKYYALHYGFEAIGIRLGGVTRDNTVRLLGKEPAVWLSHQDLTSLVKHVVSAKQVLQCFEIFYAVSNNHDRVHDVSNSFGWFPLDNSKDFVTHST